MKKTVLMCAVVALALTATSCGNTNKKENNEVNTENVTKGETTPVKNEKVAIYVDKAGKVDEITVKFQTEGDKATIQDANGLYELVLYETASGFGYKNETITLQGKGADATLTYADGTVVELTEKVAE